MLADAQVGFILLAHKDGQVEIHIGMRAVVAVLPQVGDVLGFVADEVVAQHVFQLVGGAYIHKQPAPRTQRHPRGAEKIRQLGRVPEVVEAVVGAKHRVHLPVQVQRAHVLLDKGDHRAHFARLL